MPVTATEVSITFRRPPHDVFGLGSAGQQGQASANGLRFRINPENRVTLTLTGKKPGAGWQPEVQELNFNEHPGADMRPYDRLIGAALNGERWLFAQQETVEAWRVVDPVIGDVVPVLPYARGSGGPQQADGLLPPGKPGTPRRPKPAGKPWGPGHRPA